MTPRRLFLPVLVLVLAACHGPKSTPDDTIDSYFDACEAHDADGLVDMTVPSIVKKAGTQKIHDYYWEIIYGMKDVEATKLVTRTGKDTAQAQTTLKYVWRIRGQNPEDHEEEVSFLLHQIGGKWYIEPPGSARVQPW